MELKVKSGRESMREDTGLSGETRLLEWRLEEEDVAMGMVAVET